MPTWVTSLIKIVLEVLWEKAAVPLSRYIQEKRTIEKKEKEAIAAVDIVQETSNIEVSFFVTCL